MILINPKGKEVEMNDAKGKKFLSLVSKIKQGWKSKDEVDVAKAEMKLKIHNDRVSAIGDLSEYIEGFDTIDFSNYEEKGFNDLLESANRIKQEAAEAKRLKEEQEAAEAKRLKEEAKKKRLANLKHQTKATEKKD